MSLGSTSAVARLGAGAAGAVLLMTAGCSGAAPARTTEVASTRTPSHPASASPSPAAPLAARFRHPLPGMPAVHGGDVYAAIAPGRLSPAVAGDPSYLYVPNSYGDPITTVIDQRTRKVVRVLHTGFLSQHVTPSYDLRTLYVEASEANRIVAINPATGRIEKRIHQERPYNLYFTPDGAHGIVMDEQNDTIAFTDPTTFRRASLVHDRSCQGPNHADFSANGRFFLVTCEFSGSLLRISTTTHHVTGRLKLPAGSKPQDVRLSPDGRWFYVADMDRDALLRLPWNRLEVVGSTMVMGMPHGIYPSRDGRFLYVSQRMAGQVAVVSTRTQQVVAHWSAPGSHPDMGGLSADGRTLWLSGRYDGYVYGWNTRTGTLVAKIHVGGNPHGLLVWPQPGRYSLGHTGNLR